MIKVLIIDDDYLVRLNLKMMIDWEKYDIEICGEAENGEEGLKLIKELKPDIAIIDVKMPVMDGVELSEKINKLNINLFFIMLSNYDEFEYVRQAMKNGGRDYLLKHKLNKNNLLEVVTKATQEIKLSKETDIKKEVATVNQEVEDFIIGLISGDINKKEDIIKYASKSSIRIGLINVIPIVMMIDEYKKIEAKGVNLLYKVKKNLGLQIKDILSRQENGMYLQLNDNKYIILMSFEKRRSQLEIDHRANEIIKQIMSNINVYFNISVTFSVGKMVNIEYIKDSYEETCNHLASKFYLGKGIIIDDKNKIIFSNDDEEILDRNLEKLLTKALLFHDKVNIELIINNIFAKIKNSKVDIAKVHDIINKLINIINEFAHHYKIPVEQIFNKENPKQIFQKLEILEDFYKWILQIFNRVIHVTESLSVGKYSEYVTETIIFIRKNYSKDISLSIVAEEIGINSSYLSTIFKDEVGIGFNQFLCNERIKYGEVLMRNGSKDIKEIAKECGFNNYSYFFNVFKKKTGQTPKQYISSL